MQRLDNKAKEISQNVEQKGFIFKVRHEETIRQVKQMLTATDIYKAPTVCSTTLRT